MGLEPELGSVVECSAVADPTIDTNDLPDRNHEHLIVSRNSRVSSRVLLDEDKLYMKNRGIW